MTEPRRAAEDDKPRWFNFLEILQEPESPRRKKSLYAILNDEDGVEDPISVDVKYATGGVVGKDYSFDTQDSYCGYIVYPDKSKEN